MATAGTNAGEVVAAGAASVASMPGERLDIADYEGVPKIVAECRGGPLDGQRIEAPIHAEVMLFLQSGDERAVIFGMKDSIKLPRLKRRQSRAVYARVAEGDTPYYKLESWKRR